MPILLCAITSCGTQGETGPKGETGAQGPKGETGEKGEKGDTYYPVVILGSTNGTIKTDKVEGKAGDKYTLTFTPKTEGNIVTSLYINYEEVELTDEILGGTYTGTFNGSVIVSATFGDVKGYGESLIENYYNEIAKVDTQMDILVDGEAKGRDGNKELADKAWYVKDFVASDYYDDSVAKVALEYSGKVEDKINALKKDATTKEKIEALKTYAEEAQGKIDSAYAEVVKAAKEKAVKNITSLYSNDVIAEYMDATDMASMIASCKGEVEGATSLSGLASVIASGEVSSNGKYNLVEQFRAAAFESLDSAISAVYESDSQLDPGSTTAEKEAYEKFVDSLEEYGIKEEQLPASIYKTYLKKISTATSFEYYVDSDGKKTGESVLEHEAVEAVEDSSENIVDTVRKQVLESYFAEIDESKELSADASKVAAKATVETTISEWFKAHKNDTNMPANVTNFMSTYHEVGDTSNVVEKSGCIGLIEARLDEKYTAFQSERLGNKLKSIASEISAAADEIINADSLYKSVINYTLKDEKTNPNGKDEDGAAEELGIQKTSFNSLRTDSSTCSGSTFTVSNSYNVKALLGKIVTSTDGGTTKDGGYIKTGNFDTVADLLDFKAAAVAALKRVYQQAKDKFIETETSGATDKKVTLTHTGYGRNVVAESGGEYSLSISSIFSDDDTITTIKSKIDKANVSNWQGLVDILGYYYKYYFDYGVYDDFDLYGKATGSETWAYMKAGVKAIQSGEIKTASAVKDYAKGFFTAYATDLGKYYESQLSALTDYKTNLVNLATAAGMSNTAQLINNRFADWVSMANKDYFTFYNRGYVDMWLSYAMVDLDEAAAIGDERTKQQKDSSDAMNYKPLYSGDTYDDSTATKVAFNNATTMSASILKALDQCEDFVKITKVGGKLLTSTERGYVDVQALVVKLQAGVYGASNTLPSGVKTAVENVIKLNDSKDGYVVNGTSNNGETLLSNAKTNGANREAAKKLLKSCYESKIEAATTGDDKKAENAALKVAYEQQLSNLNKYNAQTGELAIKPENNSGTNFDGFIKKDGEYSGTAVTAMGSTAALATYLTYVETESARLWNEYVLSYPEYNGKLFTEAEWKKNTDDDTKSAFVADKYAYSEKIYTRTNGVSGELSVKEVYRRYEAYKALLKKVG